MSQAFLLQKAKQGNSQAIADLLNQSLAFKKVKIIDTLLEDSCLQLKLESRSVISQHRLIPFIKEEITSLRINIVEKLDVQAFVIGTDQPAWQATVTLQEHNQRIAEFSHILSAKTDEVEVEEVSLELRAKRGEQAAILELLNQELEPKTLTAKLRLNKGYLQVLVVGDYLPEQEDVVELIRHKLTETRLPIIKKVTIYGMQTEDELPAWHEDFENINPSETVKSKRW